MKKINKEKSVVYSQWSDPIFLTSKGTLVNDFNDLESYYEGTICGIRQMENPFMDKHGNWYKYFVPVSTMVLENEKKLRPYKNVSEFLDIVGFRIGDVITIKRVDCEFEWEETSMFVGFRTLIDKPQTIVILLGLHTYTFKELMENFKYYKENEWYSFGIEE